jgi:hypothetical protein
VRRNRAPPPERAGIEPRPGDVILVRTGRLGATGSERSGTTTTNPQTTTPWRRNPPGAPAYGLADEMIGDTAEVPESGTPE